MSWYDPWDIASETYHLVTGQPTAKEKRSMAADMKSQMDEYRKARELTEQQINTARDEKRAEKRRIEEKQIRGLRNNYRSPGGFLNNQKAGLGNEAILPNKLGTI